MMKRQNKHVQLVVGLSWPGTTTYYATHHNATRTESAGIVAAAACYVCFYSIVFLDKKTATAEQRTTTPLPAWAVLDAIEDLYYILVSKKVYLITL